MGGAVMTDFRVTFDDGGLFRRFADAPRVFAEENEVAVRRTSIVGANTSKGIVRAKGRIDLGRLLGSLAPEPVRRLGNTVFGGWGTDVQHARVNESGRRPGARRPPTAAILPWMARHGIPAEAAFVVARSIGRRGTPGIFFLRDALTSVKPLFRREVQMAANRAASRLIGGRR
jgi:hypothetical protein